ncbi:MAG: putative transport system permease protein [Thermoleophilaceae bacterium]|nr:putative transport system permease protein [Thermoleophilaceae bacterium]
MRVAGRLAISGLARAPGRTLTRILVLAAATALLGSMLLFVGDSLRTMTAASVRSVPLDWQGPVPSYQAALRTAAGVARQPGVAQASATATAPLAGATHRGAAGTTTTGSGAVLAVPPGYERHIQTFRLLQGGFRPGQVVLDQQMAATLQAHLGDPVKLSPGKGKPAHTYPVSGVAIVTSPDVLFQPLNPQVGPTPAQPPANIALLPLGTFASTYARAVPSITPATVGSNAVPGAQTGVQWQVQAQADPLVFHGSPSAAYAQATHVVNRVQRNLPGQVVFVDNLADQLNTAAGDALYAEALYIMLAVPGALIALGLVYLAALGAVERDRRDLALLRAHGATRRDLVVLAGAESLVLGLVAGLLGAALAVLATSTLIAGGVHLTAGRVAIATAACLALAVAGAMAARMAATGRILRGSVAEGRTGSVRLGKPLWQRLYVDVAALVVSGLVYWLTARTGFSAVVNPDSNPTLSLSVYMFLAPALLWIGTTLLLVRLRGRALAWAVRRFAGRRAENRRGFLLMSAGRRGGALNRGLTVVGLLLAFGVNLGLFSATYDQQASVDAELTLGADVTVTAPPGVAAKRDLAGRIARVPGVTGTTAVDHSYAYVGPDLQDTFGIDPQTIDHATTLRDYYFLGGSAHQMLDRLSKRPDAILVSKETITDYSLKTGDLLKLRVVDQRTGGFRVVPFHVAGAVQEFPSAPKDSFMVANIRYLQAADHGSGPNVVFARTSGNPPAVARRVAAATRADGTVVKNIREQTRQTVSSITTVDLRGISRIEEAFTVLLAAAAMALFVTLIVAERRHEFATMVAVGASLRDVAAFVWSESALVLGAGLLLAGGLGWLLSAMLVAMLQHVFDPPPDTLAVPGRFLLELGAGAILGWLVATGLAARSLGRLQLGALLRER